MKNLKMFGLAVIAALGLVAFIGAGTASAVTLWTDKARTIDYPAGTIIDFSAKSTAKFTSGGSTVDTCTRKTLKGKTKATSAATLWDLVEAIAWEGCTATTDTISNGEIGIEWSGESNGKVVGVGTAVTLAIFGTSCTYGTGEGTTLGTLTGGSGEEATLNISTTLTKTAGNFLCPATVGFESADVLTQPHALFVGP